MVDFPMLPVPYIAICLGAFSAMVSPPFFSILSARKNRQLPDHGVRQFEYGPAGYVALRLGALQESRNHAEGEIGRASWRERG